MRYEIQKNAGRWWVIDTTTGQYLRADSDGRLSGQRQKKYAQAKRDVLNSLWHNRGVRFADQ